MCIRDRCKGPSFLVSYADDVVVVITARDIELAPPLLSHVIRRVSGWIKAHGLELAISKTETVMLTI